MAQEVNIVVSDLQLADGPENPLEDFPHDRVFLHFLERIMEQHGSSKLRLRLLGDIFDPLAVPLGGTHLLPETEKNSVGKMERIIRAHPVFFLALHRFLSAGNTLVDFFAGNHDLFLCWESVQRLIRTTVSGGDHRLAWRIRFITHHERFFLREGGVHYEHGHNAELSTAVDPFHAILTHRDLRPLAEPVLNTPTGSYLFMTWVLWAKATNRVVDRLPRERDIWSYSARYRPWWGVVCGLMLIWSYLRCRFHPHWHVRLKSHAPMTIWCMLKSFLGYRVDAYARRILEQQADIDVVVCGHSHTPRLIRDGERAYVNTGTWAQQLRLERNGSGSPNLVPTSTFSFARITHENGRAHAELLRFEPSDNSLRACLG